jgi:GTP cyclohydrolase I
MKYDAELGRQVQQHLVDLGVETPMNGGREHNTEAVASHFKVIMEKIGCDMDDDSMKDSPHRVASMFMDELFTGMNYDNFPKCTVFDNKMNFNSMVVQKNIIVKSVCEHHFQTIYGKCHVAYIPTGDVVGLSKLNRVVNFFGRRPQVQERLTEQVFRALQFILKTEEVAVYMECDHFCVKARGVEDVNSSMVTSRLGGAFFSDEKTRAEFISIANR